MGHRFWEIYDEYIERPGAKELKGWLCSTDIDTCPASTKYHEAYPGGLMDHSVKVWDELKRLLKAYPEVKATAETAAIVALLHDIAKLGSYRQELRNKKDEFGKWVQVPFYTFDEKFKYGSHGGKSVYLIQKFMQLTDEEGCAINTHMGPEAGNAYIYDVYRASPLSFLLHTADMAATIKF